MILRLPPLSMLRAGSLAAVLAIVIAPAALAQQTQPRPAGATPSATPSRPAGAAASTAAQPRPAAGAASGTAPSRSAPAGPPPAGQASGAGRPAPTSGTNPAAAGPTRGVRPAAGAAGAAAGGAAAAGPLGSQAEKVAEHGAWAVYMAQAGRSKICYALAQPKDRQPKTVNRDPAYFFVSFRPAESVRNEIALVMGFPTKEDGPAEAAIGSTSYALLTKEANAWLKNAAEEGQAIATMSRGRDLVVKVQSRRGTSLTDVYSLAGFAAALERARKECP